VSREETPEPWPLAASKSPKEQREALIFRHVPKTAGTTLNRIIEWQCSPFAIFTMDPYRIGATAERLKRLASWEFVKGSKKA
jgi:hypothetical protein